MLRAISYIFDHYLRDYPLCFNYDCVPFTRSCELCTGQKVPDSTRDDNKQEEISEHEDSIKYIDPEANHDQRDSKNVENSDERSMDRDNQITPVSIN